MTWPAEWGNESTCGRFTLTRQNRRELAPRLGADEDDFRDYRPRYNIAPTDPHFIVTSKDERRTGRAATRGLVTWEPIVVVPAPVYQRQSREARGSAAPDS